MGGDMQQQLLQQQQAALAVQSHGQGPGQGATGTAVSLLGPGPGNGAGPAPGGRRLMGRMRNSGLARHHQQPVPPAVMEEVEGLLAEAAR